ncbi:hypothetical protein [Thalassospira lucentensis]|uniref:hypothetical protein n=1 Tax=Thalassospira lucentensis TaxID=168935 RepID=UPI003AA8E0E5
MKIIRMFVSIASVSFGLAACQTTKEAENMAELGVDFNWADTKACSSKPPKISVTGIPASTKTLNVKLKDLNVPTYNHGGGTVDYNGGDLIPAGAFNYKGPCPPSGSHDYRFTVEAISADGQMILGRGANTKAFPPK